MFKWFYNVFLAFSAFIILVLLVSAFPITGNIRIMIVQSGSMEPAIHTGSLVVSKPAAEYAIDDIITFNDGSGKQAPTTHRIIEINNDNGAITYITKGDANNGRDRKGARPKNVIGKVLFSVPYLGYIVDFIKKPLGFFLVALIPALLIISEEAKKIWQEIKKIKKKRISDNKNNSNEA